VNQEIAESFLELFSDGDADGAASLIEREPELASLSGYKAHPLLQEFVGRNGGHCYRGPHLLIADLLIPASVRSFRDAVIGGRLEPVQTHLSTDPEIVGAEFTAGRGIAQAIHHWVSTPVAVALLDAGADINAQTTLTDTPLSMKLRFGTVEGVRFLLERGANPNGGRLKFMSSSSMPEMIEQLLEYGWDINEGGERTLLHHDANHGHGSKVQLLLRHGADPNVKDANGKTALHLIAARGVGRSAIQALVKAGADVNVRDDEGNTPLNLARRATRQTASQELKALGAES